MNRTSILLVGATLASLSIGPAFADCAADIAALRAADANATASTAQPDGKTTNFETGENVPQGGEISKDGNTAPLQAEAGTNTGAAAGESAGQTKMAATGETPSASAGTTTTPGAAEGGAVSKDGGTMPLASSQGANDTSIAMSDQGAASQQSGQKTAAAGAAMTAALEKADAAAKSGDEAACTKILEEAQATKS
jgi:hypothetical protein